MSVPVCPFGNMVCLCMVLLPLLESQSPYWRLPLLMEVGDGVRFGILEILKAGVKVSILQILGVEVKSLSQILNLLTPQP